MIYWKIIIIIAILGIGNTLYHLGWIDWIKDWKRVLRYARDYAIVCGIGLNIYWMYMFVTNV